MLPVDREEPLAAVLSSRFTDLFCATCFSPVNNSVVCDDCLQVSYCSLKCQRKDWRNVHQSECEILRKFADKLTDTMRLCLRVILTKDAAAKIDKLETNYSEFRSSPRHNQFLSDLLTILPQKPPIGVICSVLCNSFAIIDEHRAEPVGIGLFPRFSTHNHSCSSKNHVVFENNQAILRSTPDSTNSTISYVSRMLPTSERRKSIRAVHFVTCQCEMCHDEATDRVGLAGRCRQCKSTIVFDLTTKSCPECGKFVEIDLEETSQMSSKLLDTLENLHKTRQFENVSEEFDYLTQLRQDYGRILADCNVALCQLDEQIAYCMSQFSDGKFRMLARNFDPQQIAAAGCEFYITRLSLGAAEVTRRLFIACKLLEKCREEKMDDRSIDLIRKAAESANLSHGDEHSISKFLNAFSAKFNQF